MNKFMIETNGTEISIQEHSTNGEPIFLLHPGGSNGFIWHKVIPYFTEKYRVFVMDMRGHGQSKMVDSGYSMENQALDIIGVMDFFKIDKAHLIGNSLGTDVGVYAAARFPNRVNSLVNIDAGMLDFIGPNGENDGDKEYWVQRSLNRPVPEFESREEFASFIKEHFSVWGAHYVEQTSTHIPLRTLPNGKVTHAMPGSINSKLMEAWCDMRFETCYPTITCPVLFLPAEQEPKLEEKLEIIEKYRSNLPWSQVKVIAGTSHVPLVSHHQEVSEAILEFLEKVEAENLIV